ncbi:ABC transporter substrate-binding protein [Nostoc sp. UCD121]|uniref:ABC transporter substrate-binding protein n=1 Tax=unclassified Nostoc TaxID=2593658 RepID=UPI00162A9FEB|nr:MULTISPECIES: ABC transporter substrate-binding protein [unclassified Nostoc]MBC1222774.1 ABC transporter substrate-binding protein [Nostoc sp. UCD120]MBC1279249.1 ABC transporter substrate-binding protein [Nostoc sp. UCD121]MBC1298982.1 ABC transporter substrate-binding protein [Nostoc sp. UCD122]
MHRRWLLSALALLMSIVLAACTTATTQQPQIKVPNPTETTKTNSQQLPTESAKRVVALSSLSADIISRLAPTKIVGITGSKLFKNDSRFKDIPRVSEGQNPPNLEKVVTLKPDLVIGAEGFSNIPIQKLQQLGIPTLLAKVNNWESLEELTKTLAKKIDADPQPLLNRYKSLLPEKPTQSFFTLALVSRQPILSPNKNSWAGDLLAKFQAKNIAADLQGKSPIGGYVTLSAEKVLEANPEVIILVNPPQGNSEVALLDSLKKEAFWQQLKATKNNRVYVFDYYGLVNPGSIDAIEKACQQLKQVLFAPQGT